MGNTTGTLPIIMGVRIGIYKTKMATRIKQQNIYEPFDNPFDEDEDNEEEFDFDFPFC